MQDPNHDSALVLFSGGQDSTTCLYWAKKQFGHVETIGFKYGQRHRVELQQAQIIAEKAEVSFHVQDLTGTLGNSALTDTSSEINAPHSHDENLPAAFVPGRNALFLNMAAIYGYRNDIVNLVGGMSQTDYSGYPDCRRDFIDSMEESLSLAMDRHFQIHTPLMYLSKAETWKLASDLGVLDVIQEDTHTDYHGNRSQFNEWGYGKLDNAASKLRAKGYREAKEKGWIK